MTFQLISIAMKFKSKEEKKLFDFSAKAYEIVLSENISRWWEQENSQRNWFVCEDLFLSFFSFKLNKKFSQKNKQFNINYVVFMYKLQKRSRRILKCMQEEQNNKRERKRAKKAFRGDKIVRKGAGSLRTKFNVYL